MCFYWKYFVHLLFDIAFICNSLGIFYENHEKMVEVFVQKLHFCFYNYILHIITIYISHIITKKLQETHWIKHEIFKQNNRNSIFFVKHTPVIYFLFTT